MFVERFVAWSVATSAQERADAIGQLARAVCEDRVADEDRRAAIQVLTLALDDKDSRVRRSLAESLKFSASAPRAIVWGLMDDDAEVAAIVAGHSPLLKEIDLLDIAVSADSSVQKAVAGRADLTPSIVRELVSIGTGEAIAALLDNPAIALSADLKHDIASRLGCDASVRDILLQDESVLPKTRHLLVSGLANVLAAFAKQWGGIDEARAAQTSADATGRAAIAIAENADPEALVDYVADLRDRGQLTTALMVRAVCRGNAAIFEAALAMASGKSLSKVQSIIDAGRASSFRSLYSQSGLPDSAYGVFSAAIAVWQRGGIEEDALAEIIAIVETDASVDRALISLLKRMECESEREAARVYDRQLLLAA